MVYKKIIQMNNGRRNGGDGGVGGIMGGHSGHSLMCGRKTTE